MNFNNPGSTDDMQLGNLKVTSEMSYIHATSGLYEGNGNYQGTSTWRFVMPDTNQYYVMNLSSMGSAGEPDENVVIGVANFDSNVSSYFSLPTGPAVFFGRGKGIAKGDIELQGVSIDSAAYTGNILLRLLFDDDSDLFSGAYSPDGGATYLTPFTDVASTGELLKRAELTLGGESWDVQVVPIPSSLLLLSFGLAAIGARRRLFKA